MMHDIKKTEIYITIALVLCVIIILSPGCARKRPSEKTPIHLNPDMDNQPKYKAQSKSTFFEDGATMRTPVAGTVAQGELEDNDWYYKGIDEKGAFIKAAPVEVTIQLLNRGQERYNIYCSPCHSRVGDGKGIMITRGYVPPPSFHTDRIRNFPDGQIFDIITHGVRNMPSYRHQIPPDDRWAIVAYLRSLQRSQNATIEDIPVELRETVK
ncbi:MAG: cytochrome c [Candidatus Zixiibacteriota bacterium]